MTNRGPHQAVPSVTDSTTDADSYERLGSVSPRCLITGGHLNKGGGGDAKKERGGERERDGLSYIISIL